MKRHRGFQTDHLRRLFRSGLRKPAPAAGRAPHIEVPAAFRPHPQGCDDQGEQPRDRLYATFERWTRLGSPLPEELIRRGLAAMRVDRKALGEAVQFAESGCRETRIHQSEHVAVHVLCWRSGQIGPIQERGDSACGLLVVEGTATEIVFEEAPCGRLAPSRSHVILAGTVSVARGGDVHAVGNLQAAGTDLVALLVVSPTTRGGRRRALSETIFGVPGAGA